MKKELKEMSIFEFKKIFWPCPQPTEVHKPVIKLEPQQ